MNGDSGRVAVDIARATLATEVRLRGSARSVRDAFPQGSEERQLAQGMLRIADRKVRTAVVDARTAGVMPAELAAVVGVTVQRIGNIIRGPAGSPGPEPDSTRPGRRRPPGLAGRAPGRLPRPSAPATDHNTGSATLNPHHHTGGTMAATFTTHIGGEMVELPASINGIRAALPEEWREKFDEEVGDAHARDLLLILNRWALRPTPAWDEDIAAVEALREEERQVLAERARDEEGTR